MDKVNCSHCGRTEGEYCRAASWQGLPCLSKKPPEPSVHSMFEEEPLGSAKSNETPLEAKRRIDMSNKPQLDVLTTQVGGTHYSSMAIQPIEYIMANNIGFAEGNVIKYVSRWRNKNGLQDLKKAHHMLSVLIEDEERKASKTAA